MLSDPMNSGETSTNQRLESARAVLAECFWGDYTLAAQDLLRRLDNGEPGFDQFLFSKIIENSRHPSRHLRNLFASDRLEFLLNRHLEQTGNKKRVRLVAANLTGNYHLASEYGWPQ
jgi:hypothetical protein